MSGHRSGFACEGRAGGCAIEIHFDLDAASPAKFQQARDQVQFVVGLVQVQAQFGDQVMAVDQIRHGRTILIRMPAVYKPPGALPVAGRGFVWRIGEPVLSLSSAIKWLSLDGRTPGIKPRSIVLYYSKCPPAPSPTWNVRNATGSSPPTGCRLSVRTVNRRCWRVMTWRRPLVL